jgi:prenyltransferase beta subunit
MPKRTILTWLIVLLIAAGSAAAATAFPNQAARAGVARAVNYLKTVQNPDGGFPRGANEKSSPAITAWAIMALSAAGEDVNAENWTRGSNNPVTYLQANADLTETIDLARVLLAMSAAGREPVVGNTDLAAELRSRQDAQGRFGTAGERGMINTHAWTVLALKSVGEVPGGERARQWLLGQQRADGGFSWAAGVESDPDDTAAAIQALRALGEPQNSSAIKNALAYLALCQQPDGGFSWLEPATSNAATNGWVLQGLVAAGVNPLDGAWTKDGKTVVDHLLSLQDSSGKFFWQTGRESNPIQMTAFAILGLSGKPHPIAGRAAPAAPPQPEPEPRAKGNGPRDETAAAPAHTQPEQPAKDKTASGSPGVPKGREEPDISAEAPVEETPATGNGPAEDKDDCAGEITEPAVNPQSESGREEGTVGAEQEKSTILYGLILPAVVLVAVVALQRLRRER